MSGRYALIIANTEYDDPGLAQLTAPGKDAKEFARVLDSREICAFDDVIILFNTNASRVSETLDYFFSLKKPDDLLLLYFSGHGVRDEYGSLYLAVKNTNRERLRSTAIKSDFIREAMDQSRSRRQVLILDCCNSGAFAQGTKAEVGGSVGTASAFEGTGYGRVVLTASDSTQFAWEGDQVIGETENSLFTHFLVKGLEGEADLDGDGRITVDELYDYAYELIVTITPKQTPGKWSYKQQGEIVLRQSIQMQNVKAVPLPPYLINAIENPDVDVRLGVVQSLTKLLTGKNLGLARSARETLEQIAKNEDSRRVADAAANALEPIHQEEQASLEKARAARKARHEALRLAAQVAAAQPADQEAVPFNAAPGVEEKVTRVKKQQVLVSPGQTGIAEPKKQVPEPRASPRPLLRNPFVIGGIGLILLAGAIFGSSFLKPILLDNHLPSNTQAPANLTGTDFLNTTESKAPSLLLTTVTATIYSTTILSTDTITISPTTALSTEASLTLTPIPAAVIPQGPALACNRAEIVRDITVPDGTSFTAGTAFTKTWRLKNIGSCTWTTGYTLGFDHGDQMGAPAAQPFTSTGVAPGATVDVSVNFYAPANAGTYQGDFKLRSPEGATFGTGNTGQQTFWVRIVVLPPPATTAIQITPPTTAPTTPPPWGTLPSWLEYFPLCRAMR